MVHRTAFFRPKDFPTKSKSGSSYRYCKSLGLSWCLHVFFGGQVAQLNWLSSKKSSRCRKIKFIPIVWRLKLLYLSLSLYIYSYDHIYVYIYIDAYTIMLQLAVLLQHSMLRFRDGGEGRSGREIRRSRRAAPSRADSWPWKARKRARSSNAGGWGLGVEDFETEFKGDSQMPKYRNIKGKGKGDLWSIFSNLRTVTILLMNI